MNDILITHVHWHTTCPFGEQVQQHLLRKLTIICVHITAVQHAPSAAEHWHYEEHTPMRGRAIRCDEHERLPYKRFCRTPPLCGLALFFPGHRYAAAAVRVSLSSIRAIVVEPKYTEPVHFYWNVSWTNSGRVHICFLRSFRSFHRQGPSAFVEKSPDI